MMVAQSLVAFGRTNWAVLAGFVVLSLVVVLVLGYRRRWSWTGLPERRYAKSEEEELVPPKTLWDWLQLLFIPAVLAGGVFILNQYQSERDAEANRLQEAQGQQLALDEQREQGLQHYIDAMTSLVLDKALAASAAGDETRTIARTLTLTALDRLDGSRKAAVVQFLYEAKLIFRMDAFPEQRSFCPSEHGPCWGAPTIVHLQGANLSGVDLHDAYLVGADFAGVDFRGANLTNVDLSSADLDAAHFEDANMTGAWLGRTTMQFARFDRTALQGADIGDSWAYCAVFRYADLTNASASHDALGGADFYRATLTDASFAGSEIDDATFALATMTGATGLHDLSTASQDDYQTWRANKFKYCYVVPG
jgi:hypothetical protein